MIAKTITKHPFYAKIAFIFIGLAILIQFLFIAQSILIPIVYATILAILLNPIVNFLIKHKTPKMLAIALVVLLAFVIIGAILFLLIAQGINFSESLPGIKVKLNEMSTQFLQWISSKTHIHESEINKWILTNQSKQLDNFAFGKNLSMLGHFAASTFLMPVYLCMILYYKPLFIEFIRRLFKTRFHATVEQVLLSSKKIIQSYLIGLFFELIIVSILNATGLFILGIEYAILLGVLGAVLNLIPYLGGIIGVAIFMVIALVTKTPIHMLYVLLMYSVIQFVDNNFIIPRVVAARVQLNAFVSIIVVIIGGAIWGIPGMFLSIPVTAIIKVIFDHIESLKPWGYLLGEIVPTKQSNLLKPALKLLEKIGIANKTEEHE
ncbi:MAG: AI-2E family transporter [Fluviicola sp.]|nr:AI-2E family transporter [Fluviicola sp.]